MKKMNRRSFLKASAVSAAAAVLFSACDSSTSSTSSSSAAETQSSSQEAGTTQAAAGTETETETGAAEDGVLRMLYNSEITTLNYLTSSNSSEQTVGANVIDTLLEYDNTGALQPSMATDWTYDEKEMSWTFTLREGMKWVDNTGAAVADVTAQDFVDAMKYILTPSNVSTTAQNLFGVIANAEEYYEYLNDFSNAEQGVVEDDGTKYTADDKGVVTITDADGNETTVEPVDFETVGIQAVDASTVKYTLAKEIPYFLSMLTYVCFMPAYGPKLEEEGDNFATSADTMYYNGAYYLSSYEPQVQMIYTKNEENWDAEHVYIKEIRKIYNAEASTIGSEMAKRDEIDYTTLSADVVDAWLADSETASMVSMERPKLDYSYFYCFNFNVRALNESYYRDGMEGFSMDEKYEPENWEKAVNNEAFRQSIRHAISRISTMAVSTGSSVDPTTYLQNTITPVGFAVNSETGKDYTEEDVLAEIMAGDSFDQDLALQYKEQAMKELDGKVTFPVKVLVRYNPSTTNWAEQCTVLEQQLEAVLGDDYIDVEVEAGPSDNFLSEIRRGCKYMLMLCNWGADYADPETYTDPFYQAQNEDGSYNRGMRYAYLAYSVTDGLEAGDTVKKYFELVEAAKAITDDTAKRYTAFAEAEQYLIDHALAVPYGTSVSNFVAQKLNPWEAERAAFGISNLRYKGQKMLDHFLSMEEFEAAAVEM